MDDSPSSLWLLEHLVSLEDVNTKVIKDFLNDRPLEDLPWKVQVRILCRSLRDEVQQPKSSAESMLGMVEALEALASSKSTTIAGESVRKALAPSDQLMLELRTEVVVAHLRASTSGDAFRAYQEEIDILFPGDQPLPPADKKRREELVAVEATPSSMKAITRRLDRLTANNAIVQYTSDLLKALGPTFLESLEMDFEKKLYPLAGTAAMAAAAAVTPSRRGGTRAGAAPSPAPRAAATPGSAKRSQGPGASPGAGPSKRARAAATPPPPPPDDDDEDDEGEQEEAEPSPPPVKRATPAKSAKSTPAKASSDAPASGRRVLGDLRAAAENLQKMGEDPLEQVLRAAKEAGEGAGGASQAGAGTSAAGGKGISVTQRKAGAKTLEWDEGDDIEDADDEPPAPVLPARKAADFAPLASPAAAPRATGGGGGGAGGRRKSGGMRRGKWTTEEVDLLQELMHKFPKAGGRHPWKQILVAGGGGPGGDGSFYGRTDVDLKDKWRNLVKAGLVDEL